MKKQYKYKVRYKAMTLLEMVISISIVTVLFASILPVITNANHSWQSRKGSAEAIQNGRVLIDYIHEQLVKAVKITAVSDPSEANGYIEFENADGEILRFDIASNNYVQFGPVGSRSDIAGPVSEMRFTCYALDDMDSPVTSADSIRFVKVRTILGNSSSRGSDKTFMTSAYIQANTGFTESAVNTPFEFDTKKCSDPALVKVNNSNYLCVYEGYREDGWAVLLGVDESTWDISKRYSFEFDVKKGKEPALIQISSSLYLCAYQGDDRDGWATVLSVEPLTGKITKGASFEFDSRRGNSPALAKINDTHYLCVYEGNNSDGWAVILAVNTSTLEITKETSYEFDSKKGKAPALIQVDSEYYLCTYTGDRDDGWAILLKVDTGSWNISKKDSFEFDSRRCDYSDLAKIDLTHYLCVYEGNNNDGWAAVLKIDTSNWSISKETSYEFENKNGQTPAMVKIDDLRYFCVYDGMNDDGWARVLNIDKDGWSISNGISFEYDDKKGREPALEQIDSSHYICAYSGDRNDGWAVVLCPDGGSDVTP